VGSAAIQIDKLPAPVCSRPASRAGKQKLARDLGADVVIDYTSRNSAEVVKQEQTGRGVDIVVEHVGQAVWKDALKCPSRMADGLSPVAPRPAPKSTSICGFSLSARSKRSAPSWAPRRARSGSETARPQAAASRCRPHIPARPNLREAHPVPRRAQSAWQGRDRGGVSGALAATRRLNPPRDLRPWLAQRAISMCRVFAQTFTLISPDTLAPARRLGDVMRHPRGFRGRSPAWR